MDTSFCWSRKSKHQIYTENEQLMMDEKKNTKFIFSVFFFFFFQGGGLKQKDREYLLERHKTCNFFRFNTWWDISANRLDCPSFYSLLNKKKEITLFKNIITWPSWRHVLATLFLGAWAFSYGDQLITVS